MTGEEFIALASRLLLADIGDAEARHRSAVSRAYYGAFHLAVKFFDEAFGLRILQNHTGHEQVSRILLNSGNDNAIDAGRLLGDLRTARNEADYKLHKPRLRSRASAQGDVEMASDFVNRLKRCAEEPARSQIRNSLSQN